MSSFNISRIALAAGRLLRFRRLDGELSSSTGDPRLERFDPDYYLESNPDLVEAGVDPTLHYLQNGFAEQRVCFPSPIYIAEGKPIDPERKTILFVSHEASRTGAPVLCLKIAEAFAARYNVIVLLLNGGELEPDFSAIANLLVRADRPMPGDCRNALNAVLARVRPDFSIVNSLVSVNCLSPIALASIPSVVLAHEFSSYMYPLSIIRDAITWSSQVVFSSDIIFEDARISLPDWKPTPSTHIFGQGRCVVKGDTETQLVDGVYRPRGWPEDTRVVMGAGSVCLRKGIELFVECAALVLARSTNRNIRFVWFGSGYEPEKDLSYSIYIREHIRRAGLEENVTIASAVSSLEYAYTRADAFLLTSRLDPLPNVGIDSICHGLPIFCFDNASGIAEVLRAERLSENLISPYCNSSDMADKVVRLLADPALEAKLRAELRELGKRRFSMDAYVARLEQLMVAAHDTLAGDEIAARVILDAKTSSPDQCEAKNKKVRETAETAVRRFVREKRRGLAPSSNPAGAVTS